jgi:hypothetical protein
VFLCVLFALYNLFAVLRVLPVNSSLSENRAAERGTYHRNVYRVFRLAQRQAARPFFEVRNHAIFFDRNPGMFMFAAELFARAGATTPLPNQLLSIALWNAGLVLLFLWLHALFRSELVAAVATAHLAFTPFALFYSSSIHHEPWCFIFFNLTLYCYVHHLRDGSGRSLLATCLAYFCLCQSYWFYYMSAGLLLVALQWREGKLSRRDTLLLALVPVIATLTTFLQVAYALGSFDAAQFRMRDIAAARTLDMRIAGSQWYPDKHFLHAGYWRSYPSVVRDRIEDISDTSLFAYVSMLFASVVLAGRAAWSRLRFMLLVLLAGLSWSMVMVQHTVIHRFAGMYSWFAWTLIIAVFVHELMQVVQPKQLTAVVVALALPCAWLTLTRDYATHVQRYTAAAISGQARPRREPPKAPAKPQRTPQPAAEPAADMLDAEDMRE